MCDYQPNKAQVFCGRYGKYIPDNPVLITVSMWNDPIHETDWVTFCKTCNMVLDYKVERDDAVALALQHHELDHPRDLVVLDFQ
jgi:hypothetical protein